MTMNRTSSVQVARSSEGRLTVLLERDLEPQEAPAALIEAVDEARPADPDPLGLGPVRRSSRPYAGEFLG